MPESPPAETLTRAQAWRLVSSGGYGRVIGTSGALPFVWPVAYRVVDDCVVFDQPPGLRLAGGPGPTILGFEVDSGSVDQPADWQVMLIGRAVPTTSTAPTAGRAAVGLYPDVVTGMRVAHTASA